MHHINHEMARVRFAPAPTGLMHLGNVRTALMNFLFARQKNGTFIIRIEDTDQKRNFDQGATILLNDLAWLGLTYDEGPHKGGSFGPYFQSERTSIYQNILHELEKKALIYRCFCTEQELERKRDRQIALKLPPRYDRTCLNLSSETIQHNLDNMVPFLWRFKLDHNITLTIYDLAREETTFELKNFSDFPLTRQDGSFTFLFANFVDDMTMEITHIFRGEDHLSNTANQAALFHAFNKPLPLYWHMPIICNVDGKKLSKRDFGFSLHDLRDAGYLPEAILNYLTIIGSSYDQEIMSMQELIQNAHFDKIHVTGQIRYDVEKLKWVNKKWISLLDNTDLIRRCRPFLQEAYPSVQQLSDQHLVQLLEPLKTDLITLKDSVHVLAFYFNELTLNSTDFEACIAPNIRTELVAIINTHKNLIEKPVLFVQTLKQEATKRAVPVKELFWFLRLALMGSIHGPAIHDLIAILSTKRALKRIENGLDLLTRIK